MWVNIKVQKGHTKVNVEFVRDFVVEKNPVEEAQSNQSSLCTFIGIMDGCNRQSLN